MWAMLAVGAATSQTVPVQGSNDQLNLGNLFADQTLNVVTAEKSAHELKDQARREAGIVLDEAHAEARAVTRAALAERERLLAEARKVRALLEAALDAVEDAGADPEADAQAA